MDNPAAGEVVILGDVAAELDPTALARALRIPVDGSDYGDLKALAAEAAQVARPKALYRLAYVEDRGHDWVRMDGVTFCSRVLCVNLESAHRVFAYVATCGTELDAWSRQVSDVLWQFWAEAIKETALRRALQALREDQDRRYRPGKTSTMSPGSLADWPIQQQRPLFALLGDAEEAIGVRLTDSMLMVPNKSASGLRFATEGDFASCMLCPREGCPGRRAEYDPTLYERRYAPS